jgi:hypothetical protein
MKKIIFTVCTFLFSLPMYAQNGEKTGTAPPSKAAGKTNPHPHPDPAVKPQRKMRPKMNTPVSNLPPIHPSGSVNGEAGQQGTDNGQHKDQGKHKGEIKHNYKNNDHKKDRQDSLKVIKKEN